jgi:hypothetical protein
VSLPSDASVLSFPMAPALPQLTNGPDNGSNDGFVLHRGKKRRFDHVKQVEPPVSSSEVAWTSDNFYAVLADVPVNFAIHDYGRDEMTDVDEISPFQAFPLLPSVPQEVISSTARTKRVTKSIVNDATLVKVDDDWVAMDEFCAELDHQVQQAATQTKEIVEHQVARLDSAEKFLRTEPNIDYIIQDIMRQPWVYTKKFVEMARDGDSALETLSDLHAFNRLLVSGTDVVLPYVNRQCLDGRKTSPTRTLVRDLLDEWFDPSSDLECDEIRLLDELRAIAFFELFVMAAAPYIFRSDAWVQTITSCPVVWMPHRFIRLLPTHIILGLLRSKMGFALLERFTKVNSQGSMFTTLHLLMTESMFEQGYEPVLVTSDDGDVSVRIDTPRRY